MLEKAILGICTPLLILMAVIWLLGTIADGENPLDILKDLLGIENHCIPGPSTLEEYAAELMEGMPYEKYEIYVPSQFDLYKQLQEVRSEKDVAKINYYVLSGAEEMLELELNASSRNRGQ